MSFWLSKREVWTRQPEGVPIIDTTHPATRGLEVAYTPTAPHRDIAKGYRIIEEATPLLSAYSNQAGLGARTTGVSTQNRYVSSFFSSNIVDNRSIAVCCVFRVNASSIVTDHRLCGWYQSSGPMLWVDDVTAYNSQIKTVSFLWSTVGTTGGRIEGPSNAIKGNTVHCVVAVLDNPNNRARLYLDGQLIQTHTGATSTLQSGGLVSYRLHGTPNVTGSTDVFLNLFWIDGCTQELYGHLGKEISRNPWQIFE